MTITTTIHEACGACGAEATTIGEALSGLCGACEVEGRRFVEEADRAWWAAQNAGGTTAEEDADFVQMMTLSPAEFRELAELDYAPRMMGESFE